MRGLRNTERVLKNANVDRLLEIEHAKGDKLTIDDIHDQVAGVYPRVMLDGQMDAGAWSCGMVAGLIHDIRSCKELVDRIMGEAERIIRSRLMGFLDGNGCGKKDRLTPPNFLTTAAIDRWNCARRLLNRDKLLLK
jgi:hypothetical protein